MNNTTRLINILRSYKNVVLQGVPGVGKTYAVGEICEQWTSYTGRCLAGNGQGKYAITTHPSTSYEDFVEGLRPNVQHVLSDCFVGKEVKISSFGEIESVPFKNNESDYFFQSFETSNESSFSVKDGFFIRVCKEAILNPDKDYLVLIDELNRSNVPKVFGDLLISMEQSKRAKWSSKSDSWVVDRETALVTLPYSSRLLFVPENIYIIGTMNTTDKSVISMDSALRRRFAFVHIDPLTEEGLVNRLKSILNRELEEIEEQSIRMWSELNKNVLKTCLSPESILGHSYMLETDCARNTDNSQFWIETGGMTGGSGNQVDLSMKGVKNPKTGMVHLFIDKPERDTVYDISINYQGVKYDGNEIKMYSGEAANGTWRLNLKGVSSETGTKLCYSDNKEEFKNKIIIFEKVSATEFNLVEVIDKVDKETIKSNSTIVDKISNKQNAREFGFMSDGIISTLDISSTWEFKILPQLFEQLMQNGAEELLIPEKREDWLDGNPELFEHKQIAIESLKLLDQFLSSIKLRIKLFGTGIGKSISVQSGD
ncbi:AAA family ATPase [Halobacteriovorax sp. RZ-1]|uniref:McrB family protein n=1 Tax=unclassified Halobacteriovorax TaxID=2639665 RepID=UPI00371C777B